MRTAAGPPRRVARAAEARVVAFDLGEKTGVDMRGHDDARRAPEFAQNIRYDTGRAEIRPGILTTGIVPCAGPATGIGFLHIAASFGDIPVDADDETSGSITRGIAFGIKSTGEAGVWLDGGAEGSWNETIPSSPLGVGRQVYTAQLGNRLYGVDGISGLIRYDGSFESLASVDVLVPVSPPGEADPGVGAPLLVHAPMATPTPPFEKRQLAGLAPEANMTNVTLGPATPFGEAEFLSVSASNDLAEGAMVVALTPVPDWRAEGALSDRLVVEVNCSRSDVIQAQLVLVSDAVTLDADFPAGGAVEHVIAPALDATNSATFDIAVPVARDWCVVAFDLTGLPDSLLRHMKYVCLRLVNVAQWRPDTPQFVHLGSLHLPGNMTAPVAWYRWRATDEDPGATIEGQPATGLAQSGKPFSVALNTWVAGPVRGSRAFRLQTRVAPPIAPGATPSKIGNLLGTPDSQSQENQGKRDYPGAPVGRTTVNLRAENRAAPYMVELYRAVWEPAMDAPGWDPESAEWRLVRKVVVAAGRVEGENDAYLDETSEDALRVAALQPFDTLPLAPNRDAPWYLLARGGRLFFFRTDNNPTRVFVSDLGNPESVPPAPLGELSEPGRGGFIDLSDQLGEGITGAAARRDEILIWTAASCYSLRITAEGTAQEFFEVQPLCHIGCVAPLSIAEGPGWVVWADGQGIQFMTDRAAAPSAVPLSDPIGDLWRGMDLSQKQRVSCVYFAPEAVLYVAIPGKGAALNTDLWRYSFRTRTWSGPERRGEGDAVGSAPRRLFTKPRQGAVSGGDTGASLEVGWIRGDTGAVERYVNDGDVTDGVLRYAEYEDTFGRSLNCEIRCPWVAMPGLGRALRLRIETSEELWEESEITGDPQLDDPRFMGSTLTVYIDVRQGPGGGAGIHSRSYSFNHNTPPGSQNAGWDRLECEVHPDLEGAEFRVRVGGSVTATTPLGIRAVSLLVQPRGPWRPEQRDWSAPV